MPPVIRVRIEGIIDHNGQKRSINIGRRTILSSDAANAVNTAFRKFSEVEDACRTAKRDLEQVAERVVADSGIRLY